MKAMVKLGIFISRCFKDKKSKKTKITSSHQFSIIFSRHATKLVRNRVYFIFLELEK